MNDEIPASVVRESLDTRTEECQEGIQYVLIRGLSGMGFAQPSAETVALMRTALAVAVEWAREDEREACARYMETTLPHLSLQEYAAAIRARGE
jgi:hypothetical protein